MNLKINKKKKKNNLKFLTMEGQFYGYLEGHLNGQFDGRREHIF